MMMVGDIVTCSGKLFLDGKELKWVGVVVEPCQPHRWRVLWNDGKIENLPETMLELVCR